MKHKIVIEIEDGKEWESICALSSMLQKPVSEMTKDDLIGNTKGLAERIKDDGKIKKNHPENFKRFMGILE